MSKLDGRIRIANIHLMKVCCGIMPKKKKQSKFRFDVALSFAGTDRQRAEAVARASQSMGLRVFYDKDHRAYLWGKDRKEFEKIYGPDSAFVVPFISKDYTTRPWTQWEFQTAVREAQKRHGEFVLPVRIDDSRQFGLLEDQNYLHADECTPEEIADALKAKLESEYSPASQSTERSDRTLILTLAERKAMGLLVTAPMPMSINHLQGFFPAIAWRKHTRKFRNCGLIEGEDLISPTKEATKGMKDEIEELNKTWFMRLEELSNHPDCAFFLSLHYLSQNRYDEAVLTLADAAIAMEPSWMLGPYVTAFEQIGNPTFLRKLKPETKLYFRHAYGKCLLSNGSYEEAREQYQKLKRSGTRSMKVELAGLALLNIGVTYHKEGEFGAALGWYERAQRYSEEHNLQGIYSDTLCNLGQLDLELDEPASALSLFSQAIQIKTKQRDKVGIASILELIGVAYAELGDFGNAVTHYEQAEKAAKQLDYLYLQSLILLNKAHTLSQFGKYSEAERAFKRSLKIAEDEGYQELRVRGTEGISRIHFEKGRLEDTETCMLKVLELSKKTSLTDFEMAAYHGLWIVYSIKRQKKNATRHYRALTRLARNLKAHDWLIRAIVDKSRTVDEEGFGTVDVNQLRQLIRTESKREDHLAIGLLWHRLAQIVSDEDVDAAIDAYKNCIECFEDNQELIYDTIDVYEMIFSLQWEHGMLKEAIETLDTVAVIAKANHVTEQEIASIDQKGFCLQTIDRLDEALPLHKEAVERSIDLNLHAQAIISLQNLAECYRRLGEVDRALQTFDQAREISERQEDDESIIQIDHGRALVLRSLEQYDKASALLKKCRSSSKKHRLWHEYICACEAIADLSWLRGRMKTAVKQYESALAACEEYHLDDDKPGIALSLARLSRSMGEHAKGVGLLEKHLDIASDPFMRPDYFTTLAELCHEIGRNDDARIYWHQAIESAEFIGDEEETAYCRSQYAEFEHKLNNTEISVSALATQLKAKNSPENHAVILKQLFEVLLQGEDESRAIEIFGFANKHMRKYGFSKHLIDIHMMVFDHNWNGDSEHRLNALQAYIMGMITALEDTECHEHMSVILRHVMRRITDPKCSPTKRQLKSLRNQLEKVLSSKIDNCELLSFLLTPLDYAERIIPINNNPNKVLVETERFFREYDDEESG